MVVAEPPPATAGERLCVMAEVGLRRDFFIGPGDAAPFASRFQRPAERAARSEQPTMTRYIDRLAWMAID